MAFIGADKCLKMSTLKDRFEITKEIVGAIGNKCKKEAAGEPDQKIDTPDGIDKYWGIYVDNKKNGYGRCIYAKPAGR